MDFLFKSIYCIEMKKGTTERRIEKDLDNIWAACVQVNSYKTKKNVEKTLT